MSYVATTDITSQLATRLGALTIAKDNPDKLFQRVGVFGANRMVEALRTTFASEARVAFIVPGGDSHSNSQPDALLVHSRRSTRIAVLFGDQVMNSDTTEAVIGGQHTVGILPMKDRLIQDLTDTPLDLAGVALVPTEGEPLVIASEAGQGDANTIGRECWLQWFATYAGEAIIAVP